MSNPHRQKAGSADTRANEASLELVRKFVPLELTTLPRWVCWDGTRRSNGKLDKTPLSPHSGRKAMTNRAGTWSTFDQAAARALSDARVGGVGLVLSDSDYWALDLDHIIDLQTGEVAPAARRFLSRLTATYTELSPSGDGLHVIFRGQRPAELHRTKVSDAFGSGMNLEIFGGSSARYITMTGNVWNPDDGGNRAIVEAAPADIEAILALLPVEPKEKSTPAASIPPLPIGDEMLKATLALRNVPSDDYHEWIHVGMALHSAFGDAGKAVWVEWSRKSAKFDEGAIDKHWRSFHNHPGGKTIAYVYWLAIQAYPDWRREWQGEQPHASGATTESTRETTQADAQGDALGLGIRDPASGRVILSPKQTLPTAQAFVDEHYQHNGLPTLRAFGDTFWRWANNCYYPIEDAELRNQLHPWLHGALRWQTNRKTEKPELVPFDSNPMSVTAALETIRPHVFLADSTPAPCWLSDAANRHPVHELLPFRTGTLHVPSGQTLVPTPQLFNFAALDFDYDPRAPQPRRWMAFLQEVFGDDQQSILLLQEWFGYCLTTDTRHHKILLVVGPKRAGKGTIARILRQLVGVANVVCPTVGSLAGQFGLHPLLGKTVATVSDARFAGSGTSIVVERLLSISGEDPLTVDRKYLPSITVKLPVRFMFLTNELPRFDDASTALASRFMVLRLTRSFFGVENPGLTEELLSELPGILLWAIDGWRSLHVRGRFQQPDSSLELVEDIEDLSSPVQAFLRERCEIATGQRTEFSELYEAWQEWCADSGCATATSKQTFGRDLRAAVPGLKTRRGTGQARFYEGIGLKAGGSA
jgi:P4 family phage/plasmid primase-like protien